MAERCVNATRASSQISQYELRVGHARSAICRDSDVLIATAPRRRHLTALLPFRRLTTVKSRKRQFAWVRIFGRSPSRFAR